MLHEADSDTLHELVGSYTVQRLEEDGREKVEIYQGLGDRKVRSEMLDRKGRRGSKVESRQSIAQYQIEFTQRYPKCSINYCKYCYFGSSFKKNH